MGGQPTDSALVSSAKAAGDRTAYDRVIEGGTDAVAMVPVFGPVVAGILRQIVPKDHELYLARYLLDVAERIDAMAGEKLDRGYLQSEEWRGDVEESLEALGDRRNRDKRRHFVAALANAATTEAPAEVERHRFFDLLRALRPSHLRLLAVVATSEDAGPVGGGLDGYLTTRLPDQDLENIKLDWNDLQRSGLLADMPSGLASTPVHMRVWHSLPAIGKRFVAFVEAIPPGEVQDADE